MGAYRDLSNLPPVPDSLAGVVLPAGIRSADPLAPLIPAGITPQQIAASVPRLVSGASNGISLDGGAWLLPTSDGGQVAIPLAPLIAYLTAHLSAAAGGTGGASTLPGNAVIGPDGQPVPLPDGSVLTLGPAGGGTGPRMTVVGPDGQPVPLPDGSTLTF